MKSDLLLLLLYVLILGCVINMYFDNKFTCKLFYMCNLEERTDRLKVKIKSESSAKGKSVFSG